MTRRQAREAAFALVYGASFHDAEEGYEKLYEEEKEYSENAGDSFTKALFLGTMNSISSSDPLIEKYSVGWKVERLSRVSSAILRLAVYEMLLSEEKTPYRVVINEAVELAKKYDGEKATPFINGILNKIAEKEGLKG